MKPLPTIRQHINHYLLAIISVFSFISILFIIGMNLMNNKYTEVFDKMSITADASTNVELCNQYIQDYILTGDLYYFRQYDTTIVNIQLQLEQLERISTTEASRQVVISLENLYDSYIRAYIDLYSNYSSMYKYYPKTRTYIASYEKGVKIGGYIQDSLNEYLDIEVKENTAQYEYLTSFYRNLSILFLVLLIGIFILTIMLAVRISSSITRPLEQLSQTAGQIASGDLDAQPCTDSELREISLLSSAFVSMTKSLKQSLEESKNRARLELLYKETRYRALLAQVHPHFLFNLLSAVSQSAMTDGSFETVEIVGNICKYLRYSINNFRPTVTLQEELDIINTYIYLQKTRFTFPLDLQVTIDPSLDPSKIHLPWMSLQPIIENSVVHGLEPTFEIGQIRLSITPLSDSRIEIRITDNGVGIRQDILDELNRTDTEDMAEGGMTSDSIGIHNIRDRLAICYKGQESFQITSSADEGTTVIIQIPTDWEDDYTKE